MTGKDDTGLIEDESNMTSGPSDRLQALENTKGLTGAWKNRRDMREIMPRFIAFAGITALQLDGWYRNNRYCGHCGGLLKKDLRSVCFIARSAAASISAYKSGSYYCCNEGVKGFL